MRPIAKFRLAYVAAAIFFGSASLASAQDVNRNPECLREQLAVQEAMNQVQITKVPEGVPIMTGPFGDPLFSDPYWVKYQAVRIDRVVDMGSKLTTRYSITIHYMFNTATKQVAQVKLKNTKEAGCDGIQVIASVLDLNGSDSYVSLPEFMYPTPDYEQYESEKTGTVIVGPIVDVVPAGRGCVHVESVLPGGKRAGDVKVGDVLRLADPLIRKHDAPFDESTGIVTVSRLIKATGYRIVTESGVALVCSDTAPIPTKHGLVVAPKLLDEFVPVFKETDKGSQQGWDRIITVTCVGPIDVQQISVGDRCFWAGELEGAYILHHNRKAEESDS